MSRPWVTGPWEWVGYALQSGDQSILWPNNVPSDADTTALQIGACGVEAEEKAAANLALIVAAPELAEELIALYEAYANDPAEAVDRMHLLPKLLKKIGYSPKL